MIPGVYGKTVIEYSLIPGDMGAEMARIAGGGETGGLVIGIGCVFIILSMTAITIGGQIITGLVTGVAIQWAVRPLQTPVLVMIEGGIAPCNRRCPMTGHTIGWESG